MCEFCSGLDTGNRDQFHSDYSGFYCPKAINKAMEQVNADRRQVGGDADDDAAENISVDDDGT